MTIRIWERSRDWILLLTLLLASVGVLLTRNEAALLSARRSVLQTTAGFERMLGWVGSFYNALEENSVLRADNVRLSSLVARSRQDRLEADEVRRLLGLRDDIAPELVAARIVSKDVTADRNLLTIDAGALDGIRTGMAVINDRGIIGKTVIVSDNFCRVMPYTNTDMRIPARVLPSQADGIIRWDPDRRHLLVMDFVVKTESVSRGDAVVASGYSQVFPRDYPIGTVDSVISRPGRNERVLWVAPSARLNTARYVFVTLSRTTAERDSLEAQPVR